MRDQTPYKRLRCIYTARGTLGTLDFPGYPFGPPKTQFHTEGSRGSGGLDEVLMQK